MSPHDLNVNVMEGGRWRMWMTRDTHNRTMFFSAVKRYRQISKTEYEEYLDPFAVPLTDGLIAVLESRCR